MKTLTACVAVVALTGSVASATTLTQDAATTATGNYGGQTFTVVDTGFSLSGDPLNGKYNLDSIALRPWSATGGASAIYLNIYDGATFLGSSTNTHDWTVGHGNLVTYDFTGVAGVDGLNDSTVYSARFSTTSVAGTFVTVRPGVVDILPTTGGPLVNGTLITTAGAPVDTNHDARMVVNVTPAAAPEPSTGVLCLLVMMGAAIARRSKRR